MREVLSVTFDGCERWLWDLISDVPMLKKRFIFEAFNAESVNQTLPEYLCYTGIYWLGLLVNSLITDIEGICYWFRALFFIGLVNVSLPTEPFTNVNATERSWAFLTKGRKEWKLSKVQAIQMTQMEKYLRLERKCWIVELALILWLLVLF